LKATQLDQQSQQRRDELVARENQNVVQRTSPQS
jgi:hypothetical protein